MRSELQMMMLRSKGLKVQCAQDVCWQHEVYKGLEPLVLKHDTEVDTKRKTKMKS
jgi:hypothetical protein